MTGKSAAIFELQVGAVDKFSGPFKGFGQAVDLAKTKVQGFGKAMGLVKLGAAAGGLGAGLGRVKSEALGLVKTVGLISGIGGGGAAAGLFGLVKGYANVGDEASKMAQRAGITARGWQEMSHVANLSAVSTEELLGAYTRLGKASVEAAQGGKAQAAAFRGLGVSLKTADGRLKNSDVLMMEVAESLSKLPDGAQKSARAMEIFGKSGANLLPMLNAGRSGILDMRREAVRMGLVFGDEAPKAAENFINGLTNMKENFTGLAYIAGGALLPVAQGLVDTVNELINSNRDLIKTKITEWALKIKDFLPKLKKGILGVAGAIPGLIAKADSLAQKIGGWGNVAMVAAGILTRPLAGSILGLIKPIGLLAGAIATTPLGILVGLGAGLTGLMAKAGVLEPFLSGVAEGFQGMSAGLSEAFVGLLSSVSGLFGDVATGLIGVNGEINPEAWRQLGQSIGGVAGGALKDFVGLLTKAVGLVDKIGSGGLANFLWKGMFEQTPEEEAAAFKAAGWTIVDDEPAPRPNSDPWAGLDPKTRAALGGPSGPPVLTGGGPAPSGQETRHTEIQKIEMVITVQAPPGTTISNPNPAEGVRVILAPAPIGLANY